MVPLPDKDSYPTFADYYSAEKVLHGVGSHLTMVEGEAQSQQAQVGPAAMSIAELDLPSDPWMPPYKELPEGFGLVSGADEGYSAGWDTTDGNPTVLHVCLKPTDVSNSFVVPSRSQSILI